MFRNIPFWVCIQLGPHVQWIIVLSTIPFDSKDDRKGLHSYVFIYLFILLMCLTIFFFQQWNLQMLTIFADSNMSSCLHSCAFSCKRNQFTYLQLMFLFEMNSSALDFTSKSVASCLYSPDDIKCFAMSRTLCVCVFVLAPINKA